ncbi:MAG: nuclease [Halobacteriovorax sp.]|nr:nuclease [Halobacteriovorax sp.]
MKLLLVVSVFLLLAQEAIAVSHYYPTATKQKFNNSNISGEELKVLLFNVLDKKHIRVKKGDDVVVNSCAEGPKGNCYEQRSLGYRGARKVLFGKLHLEEDAEGYYIKDVYCRKKITNAQTQVGPNTIPNHSQINCEHTWPQSKFSGRFPKGLQKSDLHHLFPTDSRANSIRGNNEFANVQGDPLENDCAASYSGTPKGNYDYFEPPTEHKGNVARALFYFSIRYQIKISERQEAYLRQWHELDPVDAEERDRNQTIFEIQRNRNPFIDYPNLVDRIKNF